MTNEPTRLEDRIDWDELAELTARDMAEAEVEIKRQRDSARSAPCCVCGEPESEGYCGCLGEPDDPSAMAPDEYAAWKRKQGLA